MPEVPTVVSPVVPGAVDIKTLPLYPGLSNPVVVEDPNTPMFRATSPEVRTRQDVTSPVIVEQKSPTLLAEEAAARLRGLDLQGEVVQQPPVSSTSAAKSNVGTSAKNVSSVQISQEQQSRVLSSSTQVRNISQTEVKVISSFPVEELEKSKQSSISLRPLDMADLLGIYYNPQLANNQKFVLDFIQVRHEGLTFLFVF